MMYRALGESQAGLLKSLDHLDTDRPAGGAERHASITLTAHQSKVAVDILYRYSERALDDPAIDFSENHPVPGIRARDLIAIYDIHIVGHQTKEVLELTHVVLGVAVGIENQVL